MVGTPRTKVEPPEVEEGEALVVEVEVELEAVKNSTTEGRPNLNLYLLPPLNPEDDA